MIKSIVLRYSYLFYLVCACVFCSYKASADFYLRPQLRPPLYSYLHVNLNTRGFLSFYNYESFKSHTPIPGLVNKKETYIAFFDYTLGVSYIPVNWIEFYPYITAQTHYSDPYLLPFQVNDVGLIIKHHLVNNVFSIYPAIEFSYPIFKQITSITRIITSDEVLKLTPSLLIYFSYFENIKPFGKIAYQYRDGGLSSLLLWQAGIAFQGSLFEVGFLAGGLHSATKDEHFYASQKRHDLLKKFNNSSLKFQSVNPHAIGGTLWASISLGSRAIFNLEYSTDFIGDNYSKGHNIYASISVSILNKSYKKSYKRSRNKFKDFQNKSIESFEPSGPSSELLQEIENLK